MPDFSQLFLYIPGIIIFLVGSGQVRRWLRLKKSDVCVEATVLNCKHVVKKDNKDRTAFDYYNITVEYINPQTKHTERQAIKSATEFAENQQVRLYRDKNTNQPSLMENEDYQLFHPLTIMIGGALLIVLALEQNQKKEIPAMICLALVLCGAGISLICSYVGMKKRNLRTLDAEIVDVYTRQISKETKIIRGAKYTYYPVVKYELNGQDNLRRCNINSSQMNSFKVGEHMKLYYDEANKLVTEKHARTGMMIAGVIVLIIGLLAGASIISVL